MGKDAESNKWEDNHEDIKRLDSFSSRSSFQDIPLLLPQEADGPDVANVHKKSNDLDTNLLDHPNKINHSSYFSFRKSKVGPSVPDMQMKGFVDDHDSTDLYQEMPMDIVAQPGMQHLEKEWWETQERGDQVVSADEVGQVGPRTSCHCQVRRIRIIYISACVRTCMCVCDMNAEYPSKSCFWNGREGGLFFFILLLVDKWITLSFTPFCFC